MGSYLTLQERLVERGIISAEESERILKLQQEQHASLTRLVVELGFVSEDDLLPLLSDHLGIPLVSLKDFPLNPLPVEPLLDAVEFLKFTKMVPVKVEGQELLVATTDPTDLAHLHALELATALKVRPLLAKEKEITARIEALFGNGYSTESLTGPSAAREVEGTVDEEEVEHLRDLASEVPVIRLVNQMLSRALESRASDIHIEPFENQLKVRYRIDGILHEVDPPPRQLKAAIISRIKILAQLNIAERRLPQDGRIKVKIAGKDVDLRIATIPTLYGESGDPDFEIETLLKTVALTGMTFAVGGTVQTPNGVRANRYSVKLPKLELRAVKQDVIGASAAPAITGRAVMDAAEGDELQMQFY